jgi:hypothetical protein
MPAFGTAMEYVRQIRALTTFGTTLFDFRIDNVSVDNIIFKLHSRVTVLILLCGTVFVTMRQHFGEPIECLSSRSDVSQKLLQHYCWIESTFSISDASSKIVGTEVAYPGLKTHQPEHGERKIYHKYYQWVFFVLLIQSIMFYVPKYMWKAKEDRRLRKMITELKLKHIHAFSDFDRQRLLQDLADSLLIGNDYFHFFVFCELVYFIHLLFQIWFTNVFLGGTFYTFGIDWLSYAHRDDNTGIRFDPLVKVFPRMTKCTFHKFGVSGSIEVHDALCFLPLNIVNEKVYLILWFWFLVLIIVTIVFMIYHMLLILCRRFRYRRLRAIAPSTNRKDLQRLTTRVGNWFILQFVATHMKPSHFRDLIQELMKEHYDTNGKPHYLSKLGKAFSNIISTPNHKTSLILESTGKKEKKEKKSKWKDRHTSHAPKLDFTAHPPNLPNIEAPPPWPDEEDWPEEEMLRDPPSGASATLSVEENYPNINPNEHLEEEEWP